MTDLAVLLPFLLQGAVLTVQVTVLTVPVAALVALLVGLGRLAPSGLIRLLANVYLEVFRGTSVLVQLFVFFFVLPILLGVRWSSMQTAVLALGLNFGAYGSEVVRSAVLAVDRGQREAAVALNMSPLLTLRSVVLPQAFRLMLPPFGNYVIQLAKATSLTSLVQVQELSFNGYVAIHTTFQTTQILTAVAVIYFVIVFPASRAVRWMERRQLRGSLGGLRS